MDMGQHPMDAIDGVARYMLHQLDLPFPLETALDAYAEKQWERLQSSRSIPRRLAQQIGKEEFLTSLMDYVFTAKEPSNSMLEHIMYCDACWDATAAMYMAFFGLPHRAIPNGQLFSQSRADRLLLPPYTHQSINPTAFWANHSTLTDDQLYRRNVEELKMYMGAFPPKSRLNNVGDAGDLAIVSLNGRFSSAVFYLFYTMDIHQLIGRMPTPSFSINTAINLHLTQAICDSDHILNRGSMLDESITEVHLFRQRIELAHSEQWHHINKIPAMQYLERIEHLLEIFGRLAEREQPGIPEASQLETSYWLPKKLKT